MYKYFIINLLYVLLISVQSCNRVGSVVNNHAYAETPNQNILHLRDSLELTLDTETSPTIGYLQYYDIDTTQCLAILNDFNHTIYIYDYNAASVINKLKINTIPPQGFFIDDNIYTYSYLKGTLSVIDTDNGTHQMTASMVLPEDKLSKTFTPYPYATTLSPIIKHNNYIVSIGYRSGESKYETTTNRPVISLFDLNTRKISTAINYPEIYSKYNWGGQMAYRLPYYTTSPDGKIVVSFPASHDLIVSSFDCLSSVTSKFGGSRYIKEINSYPASKRKVGISSSDVWNWYMDNPSYEGVIYDKYRNIYYRIARLPDRNYEFGERGNHKPVVIIVLDHDLNYLGEYLMPEGPRYFPANIFVSREGLNVQILMDNEDILKFYIYEFNQNNN